MKKSISLLVVCLLFALSTKAQYLWQVSPDKVVKWNYYDGDEFNGEKLDDAKWIPNQPWGRPVLGQDIIYLRENIVFDKGIAKFLLKVENKEFELYNWEFDTVYMRQHNMPFTLPNKIKLKYTGGCVWAKKKYKYGYFEIKFKSADGQGPWPAFWLYGGEPNNEIDFFELKGEREKQIHVDVHCPEGCGNYIDTWYGKRSGWGHWVKCDSKLKSSFNVLAGEWTKDYVKFYLNGNLIAYSNHSFDLSMLLTLGTGIAKKNAPFEPGPNSKTPFPNNFDVDYMRIYKTDTLPNMPDIKKQFTENLAPLPIDSGLTLQAKKASAKLTHNPDKNVKPGNLVTLSVSQMNKDNFALRILGVNKKDIIIVTLSDEKSQLIKEIKPTENTEVFISVGSAKKVVLHAEINKQIINEVIDVQ